MDYTRWHTDTASPVFRLAAECPWCEAPLVLKRRRKDGASFLSCGAFPDCDFTEDYRPELLRYTGHAEHEITRLTAEVRRLRDANDRLRQDAAAETTGTGELSWGNVDRAIKRLLSVVHPDKWTDNPVALELTKSINAWREALREGQ